MSKKSGVKPQSRTRNRPAARSKPFFLQRLRRQDIILLSGLLMLACFSLITVGLLIVRYQSGSGAAAAELGAPRPLPVHTVTYTEITGLSQYQLAQRSGQAWAADAQLVAASASWQEVLGINQVGAPTKWNYRFYSPGKERLYLVEVRPDQGVTGIEHPVHITLPPDALSPEQWLIDSPAALATWLDYGGADLIRRNPGLEVLIQLRRIKDHEGPVWMVIGMDKRTQDIHVVVVDAVEGAVVEPERKF